MKQKIDRSIEVSQEVLIGTEIILHVLGHLEAFQLVFVNKQIYKN